jgi:ferredoxin-NADP reductase
MLSMLRTLGDRGDRRRHLLLVSARSEEDLVLRQELAVLRRRIALTLVEVVKSPPRGWTGQVGRIDGPLLDRRLPRLARHHDYFLRGPPAMVASVAQLLRQRRISAGRIHTELFDVI